MAMHSVTGVGQGSVNRGSEHMTLGVSHLIGPRWTEKKEKQFKNMGTMIWGLVFTQAISIFAIIVLFVK